MRLSDMMVRLALFVLALGVSGCSSFLPPHRSAFQPDPRTISAVGNPPETVATGELGDQIISSRVEPIPRADAAGRIRGLVLDDQGYPVADALVRLAVDGASRGREAHVRTDRAGAFSLDGLRSGEQYILIAEWEDDREILFGRKRAEAPDRNVVIQVQPSRLSEDQPPNPGGIQRVSARKGLTYDYIPVGGAEASRESLEIDEEPTPAPWREPARTRPDFEERRPVREAPARSASASSDEGWQPLGTHERAPDRRFVEEPSQREKPPSPPAAAAYDREASAPSRSHPEVRSMVELPPGLPLPPDEESNPYSRMNADPEPPTRVEPRSITPVSNSNSDPDPVPAQNAPTMAPPRDLGSLRMAKPEPRPEPEPQPARTVPQDEDAWPPPEALIEADEPPTLPASDSDSNSDSEPILSLELDEPTAEVPPADDPEPSRVEPEPTAPTEPAFEALEDIELESEGPNPEPSTAFDVSPMIPEEFLDTPSTITPEPVEPLVTPLPTESPVPSLDASDPGEPASADVGEHPAPNPLESRAPVQAEVDPLGILGPDRGLDDGFLMDFGPEQELEPEPTPDPVPLPPSAEELTDFEPRDRFELLPLDEMPNFDPEPEAEELPTIPATSADLPPVDEELATVPANPPSNSLVHSLDVSPEPPPRRTWTWDDLPTPVRLASNEERASSEVEPLTEPAAVDVPPTENQEASPAIRGTEETHDGRRRSLLSRAVRGLRLGEAPDTPTIETFCKFDPRYLALVDFRLADMHGQPFQLKDVEADYLLLYFWGTWCTPCLSSVPHFVELQDQLGPSRLQIIGIAYEEAPAEQRNQLVASTARRLGMNFPILVAETDGSCPLQNELNIQFYPTMVLLERERTDQPWKIIWRDKGATQVNLARMDRAILSAINRVANERGRTRR